MSKQSHSGRRESSSSSLAKGMYWGSRASSAAMQFVIPAAIGVWIDYEYETAPWGVIIGAALGFIFGLRELLRLMHQMDQAAKRSKERD